MATLTSKGRITIPASVRKRLGLRAGDRIDFVLAPDSTVTMTPHRARFEDLRGILSSGKRAVTVSEMDEGIRRAVAARWRRSARQPHE
jgi:AbrB family looped-hinge helix DNA binding protein